MEQINKNKVKPSCLQGYSSGQIEIDGKRFEARSSLGKIDKGENIKVVKCTEFDVVVEEENP